MVVPLEPYKLSKKSKQILIACFVSVAVFVAAMSIYDYSINYTVEGFNWRLSMRGLTVQSQAWYEWSNVSLYRIPSVSLGYVCSVPVEVGSLPVVELRSVTDFINTHSLRTWQDFGSDAKHGYSYLVYFEVHYSDSQPIYEWWFSDGQAVYKWDNWRGNY